MDKVINLNSRGQENYLKRLESTKEGKESKTYLLKVETPTMKAGYLSDHRYYLEPLGGPQIVEKEKLGDYVVDKITFVMGYGYVITFE